MYAHTASCLRVAWGNTSYRHLLEDSKHLMNFRNRMSLGLVSSSPCFPPPSRLSAVSHKVAEMTCWFWGRDC